ncbi:MAG: MFS transporter [Bacilli bacterium]
MYNTFAAPYAIELGAPEASVGLILTIAVIAEIVCFNVARRFFEPMPIRTLLLIATVASVVRWGVLAFVPSLLVFALSQILHSLTFALTHLSFMWYASQSLPQRLLPSAQGMYAAFGMSFGAGILTLVTSDLYSKSPMTAYGIMAGISAVAFVLTLFYRKGVTSVES